MHERRIVLTHCSKNCVTESEDMTSYLQLSKFGLYRKLLPPL